MNNDVGRIRLLDESVIRRIAAGETIQRPVNAVKEILENALDAGATQINILVEDGGLKLIQIQDNGRGIHKDDLPVLARRHTTSKMTHYDDLFSIETFGFRGEALCSISHVAELSIVTRTSCSSHAYRACYRDGELSLEKADDVNFVKICAGNVGTTVTIRNLFSNVSQRKNAFKNVSEEYARILEMVSCYAVHHSHVGIRLSRVGKTMPDIAKRQNLSTIEAIRLLYGSKVADAMKKFDCEVNEAKCKVLGWISSITYTASKPNFFLFVNNRLVKSDMLRRAFYAMYAGYLPKNGHPFVILSLEICPKNLDVNVHPTKELVRFLYEDLIVECTISKAREVVIASGTSANLTEITPIFLQSDANNDRMMIGMESKKGLLRCDMHEHDTLLIPEETLEPEIAGSFSLTLRNRAKPHPKNLNRLDSRTQQLTSLWRQKSFEISSQMTSGSSNKDIEVRLEDDDLSTKTRLESSVMIGEHGCSGTEGSLPKRRRMDVKLYSVYDLKMRCRTSANQCMHCYLTWVMKLLALTSIIREHVYVGLLDAQTVLIQHGVILYSLDIVKLSEEFFYQIILQDFCNFSRIVFTTPLELCSILDLVHLRDKLAFLIERREMLDEYFAVGITDAGMLTSFPYLIPSYIPDMTRLPTLFQSLFNAASVDWASEKECLDGISRCLATFYSPSGDFIFGNDSNCLVSREYEAMIQHSLLPAWKKRHWFVSRNAGNEAIHPLASLPDLYRVFERC